MNLDALVERTLVVVVAHVDRALGEDRPGVDAVVDDVDGAARDLDSVGDGIAHRVGARERRKQGGMGVDDAAGEGVHEGRTEDPHEARTHHPVGRPRTDGLKEGPVPVVTGREVDRRQFDGRDAGHPSPVDSRAAGDVAGHADHLGVDVAVGAGVEQGLQECAGARGKHHEASGHMGTLPRRPATDPWRQTMGSWLNWRYMCAVKRQANGSVMSVRIPKNSPPRIDTRTLMIVMMIAGPRFLETAR